MLHLVNATPSQWHTKRQATVETETFGSEFVATRIDTDQIIDLRYTLMYLGVPVRSKSYMFGDNKSVVDNASIPTSALSKNSTLASYLTEFRQPIQVQSHLEMPGILVQLGHIQCT